MTNGQKRLLYWLVFLLLTAGGCAVSILRLLPVKNTAVLLLGLQLLWGGVSALLSVNPYAGTRLNPNARRWTSGINALLGLVYIGVSLLELSRQGIPMLIISSPFLLALLIVVKRNAN